MKYGDSVVLVQKSRDPKSGNESVSRVNAHVLGSFIQPANPDPFAPSTLKGSDRKPLAAGEYLDVAFLGPLPKGQESTTTRDLALLYRKANMVPAYSDGAWIGWELPGAPSAEDLDAVASDDKAKDATSGNGKKGNGRKAWGSGS